MVMDYIKSIMIFYIFSSFVLYVLPDDSYKRYIELAIGVVMLIVVINPIMHAGNIKLEYEDVYMESMRQVGTYNKDIDGRFNQDELKDFDDVYNTDVWKDTNEDGEATLYSEAIMINTEANYENVVRGLIMDYIIETYHRNILCEVTLDEGYKICKLSLSMASERVNNRENMQKNLDECRDIHNGLDGCKDTLNETHESKDEYENMVPDICELEKIAKDVSEKFGVDNACIELK